MFTIGLLFNLLIEKYVIKRFNNNTVVSSNNSPPPLKQRKMIEKEVFGIGSRLRSSNIGKIMIDIKDISSAEIIAVSSKNIPLIALLPIPIAR